ncbi:unnamed protein product [Urochloa humidicola]
MPGPLLGGGDAVDSGGRYGGERADADLFPTRRPVPSPPARTCRGGAPRRRGALREAAAQRSKATAADKLRQWVVAADVLRLKAEKIWGGDRASGGCGRDEPSGACNIAPGPDEVTRTHARKRQRSKEQSDFSRISLGYLTSTPSHSHNKLSTASSVGNRKAMSTSSKDKYSRPFLKASQGASSTKRKLELQFEDSTSRTFSELPYHQQFHDLFVCPCDLEIPLGTLAHYAANNRKIDYEIPAGDLRAKDFLSPTDDTRSVIANSAGILEQLHEYDRSLAGHYDFTNFAVYKRKRVKLSDIKPGSMERLKKSSSDADYSKFALQVHKHFFSNGIPSEVEGWFRLLLQDATSHEHLIVHSILLMEAMRATFYSVHIYGELKALEVNSCSDYKDVVNYLNERHCGWKARAKLNVFTREVLEHRDPKSGKVAVYGDDAGELLRLCRNLVTHVFGKRLSMQLTPPVLTGRLFLSRLNIAGPKPG